MTQREFAQGWKLLILQPWGWRYRTLTAQGTPTEESQAQLAFYFNKLQWAEATTWMQVAELFAQGKAWPSVTELGDSLRQVQRFGRKSIPAPEPTYDAMPTEVRDLLQRIIQGAS